MVGFAATATEPFRSGKRVRARITASQAPFGKERGTPHGCTSLRGVDRSCPRPKAPRYVRNVSLCPSRGQRFPHEVLKLDPVPLFLLGKYD